MTDVLYRNFHRSSLICTNSLTCGIGCDCILYDLYMDTSNPAESKQKDNRVVFSSTSTNDSFQSPCAMRYFWSESLSCKQSQWIMYGFKEQLKLFANFFFCPIPLRIFFLSLPHFTLLNYQSLLVCFSL